MRVGLVGVVIKTSLVLWVTAFSMLFMFALLAASFTITGIAPTAKICVLYSKKLCSFITASSSGAKSCAHTELKNSSGAFPNSVVYGCPFRFLLNNSLSALV